MALRNKRAGYKPDVFVDPSQTIELDMSDPQDVVTAAQATRLKRDGEYEGLVEVHAAHSLFKTKKEHGQIKVDTRTVYILVDSNGVESRIKDSTVLASMQRDGFKITGTVEEDVVG